MENTTNEKFKAVKTILYVLLGVLTAAVMIFSALSQNHITKTRISGDYDTVKDVQITRTENEAIQQSEYRFTLDNIGYSEILTFFINHHNTKVYVGDECVYTLEADDTDMFITSGGTWITVPLYPEDVGKEITVVLTSLYSNYTDKEPNFLIGSEIAVHNATLHRALPALILCLCVMFAGVLLICLAIYHSAKGMHVGRLYALGIMAISAGVWRITYDKVAYLLFENGSVIVYTVSIVSLMLMAISMLNSLEMSEKKADIVRVISCVYSVVYAVQLVLQIVGVADLRQTLKLVHATIVVSAAAFVLDGVTQIKNIVKKKQIKFNYSWLLGVGVCVDLAMYYLDVSSFKMIFTLIAILGYAVLEGISLLFIYIEQKNELEEMHTQLALSRTTTMMSQIRSHFVFNILNAISGMCKYDPQMADETIVRFARYLRNNIDIMEDDSNVEFKTELQHLEDYVALEQVRFGDKIEYYSDVETDDFVIPPLILQPVVENAIKHGVSKKTGNGTIVLRTKDAGENVVVTVEDDGVGFDMAELDKEQSVGIRNIRFRLEHLVHGELDIQSEVGKGTVVTITIPKENK